MIDPIRQQQAVELANELIGRNTPIETIIEQLDKYFIQEFFIMVVLFLSQKYIAVKHEILNL